MKCLEGVTMEKEIEKIYICKKRVNDSEIIEKFLIQYVDGSSSYTELPSSYNKLSKPKKLKIRIPQTMPKRVQPSAPLSVTSVMGVYVPAISR